MAAITNLLAASDLSTNATLAIDRGFLLARRSGRRFTVMHAVGIDALAPLRTLLGKDADAVAETLVEEARARLADIVAASPARHEVPVDLKIERGSAVSAIPAFAETAGADLVVIGAHGSGFLERMVLGSTASRILRKSRCPVLVVKQEAREEYRRVLIAVDFSPGSNTTVRIAREVAPDAEIVLLHTVDVPFEGKMQYAGVSEEVIQQYRVEARARASQQLRGVAESAGLSALHASRIVVHGDATRNIIAHEEQQGVDLIVVGKHGTHVIEELLLGSVTNRVLALSRSDVLVVVDTRRPDLLGLAP